jgi:hypothetical protein
MNETVLRPGIDRRTIEEGRLGHTHPASELSPVSIGVD